MANTYGRKPWLNKSFDEMMKGETDFFLRDSQGSSLRHSYFLKPWAATDFLAMEAGPNLPGFGDLNDDGTGNTDPNNDTTNCPCGDGLGGGLVIDAQPTKSSTINFMALAESVVVRAFYGDPDDLASPSSYSVIRTEDGKDGGPIEPFIAGSVSEENTLALVPCSGRVLWWPDWKCVKKKSKMKMSVKSGDISLNPFCYGETFFTKDFSRECRDNQIDIDGEDTITETGRIYEYTVGRSFGSLEWKLTGCESESVKLISATDEGVEVFVPAGACNCTFTLEAKDKCCEDKDTLSVDVAPLATSITGSNTVTKPGSYQYATSPEASVTWSVAGTGASISQSGYLTLDSTACGIVTITVTNCDSSTAELAVKVTNAGVWCAYQWCEALGYSGCATYVNTCTKTQYKATYRHRELNSDSCGCECSTPDACNESGAFTGCEHCNLACSQAVPGGCGYHCYDQVCQYEWKCSADCTPVTCS